MTAGEVTETDGVAVGEPIDHRQLMAEIQAEARRLRREGVISTVFERELDAVFGRLAPPAASEDFEATLTAAEELAYVDATAPVLSEKPGGAVLKKLVRKAVFFYGKYVTDQVTEFSTTVARSVRLLARRVATIEEAVPGTSRRIGQELVAAPPAGAGEQWAAAISSRLPRDLGRVLVGESGAGGLVAELVARGFDTYGVEPRGDAADQAAAAGIEVREDAVLDHLRLVASAGLGGVVLIGCVDRLALGQQLALLDSAAQSLVTGGVLAVVTQARSPNRPEEEVIAADLSPGQPLHPPTWRHLLEANGFHDVEVLTDRHEPSFERLPGDTELAASLNRNLERLDALLAVPGSAVIVGSRSAR